LSKKLTSKIIRDSGIRKDEGKILVILEPSKEGDKSPHGYLTFLSKDGRKRIALARILSNITSVSLEKYNVSKSDIINLADLESQIMIQHEDIFTPKVKGSLYHIVREMRDSRRKELGLHPVIWRGTKPETKRIKKK